MCNDVHSIGFTVNSVIFDSFDGVSSSWSFDGAFFAHETVTGSDFRNSIQHH